MIAQRDIKHLSERYHGPQTAEQQSRDQFGTEVRVTIHMSIDRVDEYALD